MPLQALDVVRPDVLFRVAGKLRSDRAQSAPGDPKDCDRTAGLSPAGPTPTAQTGLPANVRP